MMTNPHEIWRYFSMRLGSQEIASPFALATILWLYRDVAPQYTLEVGHGIGTVTYLLAVWGSRRDSLVAVEDHPWCVEQAKANLGHWSATVLWYDKVPQYMAFEFLVIDGPQIGAMEYEKVLAPRALVIFEGNRREQRRVLETVLRLEQRPFVHVNLKPADRSKGVWVYQLEPTRRECWRYYRQAIHEWWRDLRARLQGRMIGKRRRG